MNTTPTRKFTEHLTTLNLRRVPHDKSGTLKAWDAADQLLLKELDNTTEYSEKLARTLILNDNFGALSLSLEAFKPFSVNDSYLAQLGLIDNADRNKVPLASSHILSSLDALPKCSLALIKLPKSAEFFHYQLACLNHYLEPGTPVIIAGMVKYLSRSFFDLSATQLTGMRTSLAEKKARLVFGFTRQSEPVGELPGLYRASKDRPFSLGLADTPNVFSNGKLDIGTRFLFEHFPDTQGASSIIDLGCGNGVIGMVAAKRNPEANVHFVDESYHALAAAHYNVMHNFSGEFGSGLEEDVCKLHPSQNRINAGRFTFNLSHCLDQYPSAEADLVLCNPPFHQGNTIGTRVAEKMFRDSAKVLRKGGELVVIANRHLPYQSTLKRLFGNVTLVSGNQKFVILKSTK